MITQKELKELVTYDPETGDMFWKPRDKPMFKSDRGCKIWNTRFAGKVMNCINHKGYNVAKINYKTYRLHRLIWLYVYDKWPNVIDHKNGIRTDNRLCNLRNATVQKNNMNKKRNSNNTSGFTGVYLNKKNGSWYAQITFNRKLHHLGNFDNIFDAACVRKSAENKFGFSTRHGEADVK